MEGEEGEGGEEEVERYCLIVLFCSFLFWFLTVGRKGRLIS